MCLKRRLMLQLSFCYFAASLSPCKIGLDEWKMDSSLSVYSQLQLKLQWEREGLKANSFCHKFTVLCKSGILGATFVKCSFVQDRFAINSQKRIKTFVSKYICLKNIIKEYYNFTLKQPKFWKTTDTRLLWVTLVSSFDFEMST